MNTANLQIQGMLGSLAALLDTLTEKGVLTRQEVAAALESAENTAIGEGTDELSPANKEAILFPIRYLQSTNGGDVSPFEEVAKSIGRGESL